MAKKQSVRVGRPSILNDAIKEQIVKMYGEQLTDAKIANILSINRATLHNWKTSDPEFLDTLNKAKEVADEAVEASLLKRATGYSKKATKIFLDSKSGQIVTHEYIEHYPPDPTSMIFWLKNRQPKKWRDKTDIEHSGELISIKIDNDDSKL